MHAMKLTEASGGLFLSAKFDLSSDPQPLFTLSCVFNPLCDAFLQTANSVSIKIVRERMQSAFGEHAGLLAAVIPSIMNLLPAKCFRAPFVSPDFARSLTFLLGKFVEVVNLVLRRSARG